MDIEEYRSQLHNDFATAADVDGKDITDVFIEHVAKVLIDAEEFDDYIECPFEGYTSRKANMRIDGYSYDEDDKVCYIFIADYHYALDDDSIYKENITRQFKRIDYFVKEAHKSKMYLNMEESIQAYDFARQLYFDFDEIRKFKYYLLTNAYNKQLAKTLESWDIDGKEVELNIWDISRLYELESSKTQKESIEIFTKDFDLANGIPCVKAVDYHDVKADIEKTLDSNGEIVEGNIISYSSYLAVIPGDFLSKIYLKHGTRLLEGNVRSFLSYKGKVNKGIQSTAKNYPEMFFAYNNGIAATATDIVVDEKYGGSYITYIKDLQIVNGGQTTASIAFSTNKASKEEKEELAKIRVPMKISILEHSMSEKIIPKISEYSNSQNKVDASDFFSNHPFHIRMADFSRRTPAPNKGGSQFQQYWYYERTRGQRNQEEMSLSGSDLKKYILKYPASNIVKMAEFAKYEALYSCMPHIVSKGKQEIVKWFSNDIKNKWDKNDNQFNQIYYKKAIALAILFRGTDKIIHSSDWYQTKKSYKANVVAYSISLLFHIISTKYKAYDLNLLRIWEMQDLYPELSSELTILTEQVYDYIVEDNGIVQNVTQWCKREICWDRAKKRDWYISNDFVESLLSKKESEQQEKDASNDQKLGNEIDKYNFIYQKGVQYWINVLQWNRSNHLLTTDEARLIEKVVKGVVLSNKQLDKVITARERLIKNGMPVDFD